MTQTTTTPEQPKKRLSKAERQSMIAKAAEKMKNAPLQGPKPAKRKGGPKDIPASVGAKLPAKVKNAAKQFGADVANRVSPNAAVAKPEKSVADKVREAKVTGPKSSLPFRQGSKLETMVRMVMEPKGATEAEICKKIDWPKGCMVTLRRAVKKAGLELKSRKNDDGKPVYNAV